MSSSGIPSQIDALQTQINALQLQIDSLLAIPAEVSGLQAQLSALQAQVVNVLPLATAAAPALPAVDAAELDGKVVHLSIAGIAASSVVKIYANGSTVYQINTPGSGYTFFAVLEFEWDSVNHTISAQSLTGGTPFTLNISPTNFTFSTDSANTVTYFVLRAV